MWEDQRLVNILLRMLHLGVALVVGYWAVQIDGSSCRGLNVNLISYMGYALILLNLIAFCLLRTSGLSRMVVYVVIGIDIALLIAIFFFSISGYNRMNNCAASKALL